MLLAKISLGITSFFGLLGSLTLFFYILNRYIYVPKIDFYSLVCYLKNEGKCDYIYCLDISYSTKKEGIVEIIDGIISFYGSEICIIIPKQKYKELEYRELDRLTLSSPLLYSTRNNEKSEYSLGWEIHPGMDGYIHHKRLLGTHILFVPREGVEKVHFEVSLQAQTQEDQLPLGVDMFTPRSKLCTERFSCEVEPPPFNVRDKLKQVLGKDSPVIFERAWSEVLKNLD